MAVCRAAVTVGVLQDGWGSWESWGSSLLSSAAGVTRTVLETVETGLGAPEPEHLARITRQERQKRQEPAAATGEAAEGFISAAEKRSLVLEGMALSVTHYK